MDFSQKTFLKLFCTVLFLFFQVEHSDAGAITKLLQSAGYKVLHRFAKQDIFYVKNN